MVELFTALGFAEGPRLRSKSRFRLSPGWKLPTSAELNEPSGPEPLGRDFHPLRRITASCGKAAEVFPCRPVSTRHRAAAQAIRQTSRFLAFGETCPHPGNAVLPSVETTTHPRAFSYRIEHRDYSRVPSGVAQGTQSRITPMSLRRTGQATLMASGSTGRHRGGR